MHRFLIDVNLPYRFALWNGLDYLHVFDLDDRMSDTDIWTYCLENNLVIVSKDADFSDRLTVSPEGPKLVHIQMGNCSLRDLHGSLDAVWPWVIENISQYKLIRVHRDHVEAFD